MGVSPLVRLVKEVKKKDLADVLGPNWGWALRTGQSFTRARQDPSGAVSRLSRL
jgi:hypothetical protein